MEVRNFVTFITIVETGSFIEASKRLNYAQSSITSHIKAIEEYYEQPVFDRLGKQVILNSFGESVYEKATKMLLNYDDLCSLKLATGKVSGKIRIGAYESMIIYRLSPLLQMYKTRFPDVEIAIQTPNTSLEMANSLKNGEIDIAFFLDTKIENKEFHVKDLCEERVCIVYPENFSPDSLSQSTKYSLIYSLKGCSYRKIFQDYLDQQGITSRNTIETDSLELIKQYILCGVGISLLPVITVKEEIASGKITHIPLELINPLLIQIAYHKEKKLSLQMQEFLDLALETIKDL